MEAIGSAHAPATAESLRTYEAGGLPFFGLVSAVRASRAFLLAVVLKSRCAFVEYPSRAGAEHAASLLANNLQVNGRSVTVNWAKPKPTAPPAGAAAAAAATGGSGKQGNAVSKKRPASDGLKTGGGDVGGSAGTNHGASAGQTAKKFKN